MRKGPEGRGRGTPSRTPAPAAPSPLPAYPGGPGFVPARDVGQAGGQRGCSYQLGAGQCQLQASLSAHTTARPRPAFRDSSTFYLTSRATGRGLQFT